MRHFASRTKRREVPLGLRAVRFLGFFVGLSGNAECGRSVKELQDTTEHFHKAFDCLLNGILMRMPFWAIWHQFQEGLLGSIFVFRESGSAGVFKFCEGDFAEGLPSLEGLVLSSKGASIGRQGAADGRLAGLARL